MQPFRFNLKLLLLYVTIIGASLGGGRLVSDWIRRQTWKEFEQTVTLCFEESQQSSRANDSSEVGGHILAIIPRPEGHIAEFLPYDPVAFSAAQKRGRACSLMPFTKPGSAYLRVSLGKVSPAKWVSSADEAMQFIEQHVDL